MKIWIYCSCWNLEETAYNTQVLLYSFEINIYLQQSKTLHLGGLCSQILVYFPNVDTVFTWPVRIRGCLVKSTVDWQEQILKKFPNFGTNSYRVINIFISIVSTFSNAKVVQNFPLSLRIAFKSSVLLFPAFTALRMLWKCSRYCRMALLEPCGMSSDFRKCKLGVSRSISLRNPEMNSRIRFQHSLGTIHGKYSTCQTITLNLKQQ